MTTAAGPSSREGFHPDDEELLAGEEDDHEEDARIAGLGTLMVDRRKLATFLGIIFVAIAAIYVLLPKIAGFHDVADKIDDADWEWVAVAVAFNLLAFGAYPRVGVKAVVAQVSSMKTSRLGSIQRWSQNQRARRRATSGRSCSLAKSVFF